MIPPTVTRPVVAIARDLREGHYPRPLLVAVVCWLVVAAALLTSTVGLPEPTDADQSRDALQGAGAVVASNAQDHWFVPFLPWFGVVVALLAVALLLAQSWARVVLAACGLVAVVALATAARWQVFPALIGFVLGAALTVLVPVHRYLQRPRPDAVGSPAEPAPEERSVLP